MILVHEKIFSFSCYILKIAVKLSLWHVHGNFIKRAFGCFSSTLLCRPFKRSLINAGPLSTRATYFRPHLNISTKLQTRLNNARAALSSGNAQLVHPE